MTLQNKKKQNLPSICLLDPSLDDNKGTPSSNLGDLIIKEAVSRELEELFPNSSMTSVSTHVLSDQSEYAKIKNSDLIIVGGTNLLAGKMGRLCNWKMSHRDAFRIWHGILFGVGWIGSDTQETNWKTQLLLKLALTRKHTHSVRDEFTANRLRAIGINNVTNTSCPTMWPLINIAPEQFPEGKANTALVTLTDYRTDPAADAKMLDVVCEKYSTVYCWLQGKNDAPYVRGFNKSLKYIDHSFNDFINFINSDIPFDYIGTRLHAGIRCLVSKRRSLIIEIDGRAKEIAKDTGLPTIERGSTEKIIQWIEAGRRPSITLNKSAIETWKNQFKITHNS